MGLDTFFGMDDADGAMSPDKVREFQERMARNAKHMAAARKKEGKQKKKEEKLVAILLKFIRNNKRGDITLLVVRCLEQNIPAAFVLAIVLLGNKAVQDEVGIQLQLTEGEAGAPGPEGEAEPGGGGAEPGEEPSETTPSDPEAPTSLSEFEGEGMKNALTILGKDISLPLQMRIAIDLWSRSMWDAISPIPERILGTATELSDNADAKPEPKAVVTQLAAFILRDYFEVNKFEQSFENTKGFAEFLLKGLLKRLKDQSKDQKQLKGEKGDWPSRKKVL